MPVLPPTCLPTKSDQELMQEPSTHSHPNGLQGSRRGIENLQIKKDICCCYPKDAKCKFKIKLQLPIFSSKMSILFSFFYLFGLIMWGLSLQTWDYLPICPHPQASQLSLVGSSCPLRQGSNSRHGTYETKFIFRKWVLPDLIIPSTSLFYILNACVFMDYLIRSQRNPHLRNGDFASCSI